MAHNTLYGPRRRMRWYALLLLALLVVLVAPLELGVQVLVLAVSLLASLCVSLSHTM